MPKNIWLLKTIVERQFAPTETDAYSYFSVVKKSAETALQNDVPCKVSLVVLDKWGATTTTTVTITLKK